jgi:tetratricopeptide (TPR) repeat protein
LSYPPIYQITKDVFSAYECGDIKKAHEIVKSSINEFPEYNSKFLFWDACLYAAQGQSDKALSVLNYALENDIWWASEILQTEPDLLPLKDDEEFGNILQTIKKKEETAKLKSTPKFKLITNNPGGPYIVNLHWHSTNIGEYEKYFDEYCRNTKKNMCFIQSSQKIGSHDYCWDDHQSAMHEIFVLLEKENIDISEIWGASQGSTIAYQLAAQLRKKCIALMPALYPELIIDSSGKDIKMEILIGENDPFYQDVNNFYNKMIALGAIIHFKTIPGEGHYLPEDLEDYL